REGDDRVRLAQVRRYGLGMLARIADDIGHPRLFPTIVDVLMTLRAVLRTHVVRAGQVRRRRSSRRRARGDEREMSKVGHELPGAALGEIPGRHPGVPDAIGDVIEELAVALPLDDRLLEVRRMRVFP